jgi:hypothetical protein
MTDASEERKVAVSGERPPPEAAQSSTPPTLSAAKGEDLDSIRAAVADAAGVNTGLWLSYLFLLFYLLVAVLGVTHRDLFFESPVKLPFLNVDLPLKGFFWLAPALFLIVHAYVLVHFALFAADKVAVVHRLLVAIDDPGLRTTLRRQLPINIFVQMLAGPRDVRRGFFGLLLRLIAWISLVVGPVALLVFFQLQFLPYHNQWITWWQRIAVVIDVFLLWCLWPAVMRGEPIGQARRGMPWVTLILMACITLISLPVVFVIGTFPGESLDRELQIFGPVALLRSWLVAGEVNYITKERTSGV